MTKWIKCSDRLPDRSMPVFVFANDIVSQWVEAINCYVCPEYGDAIFETADGEDYPPIVTHWMQDLTIGTDPLPDPPADTLTTKQVD